MKSQQDYPRHADSSERVRVVGTGSLGSAVTYRGSVYVVDCAYCVAQLRERESFFPPHSARASCQSGCRDHCTCDTCF